MHKDIHQSPVVVTYAQALFDLAGEARQVELVAQDLRDLRQILHALPLFKQVLSEPAITVEERKQMLKNALKGRAADLTMRFLGLLNAKGRLGLLPAITEAYERLLQASKGRVDVDVTVARRLDPDQLEQVRQRINQALKRDAVVRQFVDGSILGGMILRVQDQLIDGSVRTQLAAMKQHLLVKRPM